MAFGGQQRALTTPCRRLETQQKRLHLASRYHFVSPFLYKRALLSFALRTCLEFCFSLLILNYSSLLFQGELVLLVK